MTSSRFAVDRRIVGACFAALLFSFAACGGGGSGGGGGGRGSGDDDDTLRSGIFVDSGLAGVHFETETQSGTTGADGLFFYLPGETVEFSIGGIVLGSGLASPILTPVDLVPGALDALNPTVTNIARVLQMLDEDQNLANGINITAAVVSAAAGLSLDFSLSIVAFESNSAVLSVLTALNNALGGPRTLPSAASAQAHLAATIASFNTALGVLSVSGADVSNFGPAFVPTGGSFATSSNSLSAMWSSSVVTGPSILNKDMTLTALNGDAFSVTFSATRIVPNAAYSYSLNCLGNASLCDGVDLDTGSRSVTFDDVRLSPVAGNSATGDIVISGTIDLGTEL